MQIIEKRLEIIQTINTLCTLGNSKIHNNINDRSINEVIDFLKSKQKIEGSYIKSLSTRDLIELSTDDLNRGDEPKVILSIVVKMPFGVEKIVVVWDNKLGFHKEDYENIKKEWNLEKRRFNNQVLQEISLV